MGLRNSTTDQVSTVHVASEEVAALQDTLRQKELEISVLQTRVKELQERPLLASASPVTTPGADPTLIGPVSGTRTREQRVGESPLVSFSSSDRRSGQTLHPGGEPEEQRDAAETLGKPVPNTRAPLEASPTQPSASTAAHGRASSDSGIINFNARDVTAISEGPGTGKLTFRLVKDNPDVRFSGYLFVFVEMVDPRGETKIYAYPERTRTGEEDLPSDFREGKGVSFKQNFQGELTYVDPRQGATLSRISVLLYSEDGRIVFQRGFGPKEFKQLSAKEGESSKTKPREKRRAL